MKRALVLPSGLCLLLFTACCCWDDDDDDDCDSCDGTTIFLESEPNDGPLNANQFGVLFPGQRFFIDGVNGGTDAADRFAFTSGEPLHVDFQLFVTPFAGSSSYSLEIVVQPLFAATASENEKALRPAESSGIVATCALCPAGRPIHPEHACRHCETEAAPGVLRIESEFSFDPHSGIAIERIRAIPLQD